MIKTSCAKFRRQNRPNNTLLPTWAAFLSQKHLILHDLIYNIIYLYIYIIFIYIYNIFIYIYIIYITINIYYDYIYF